MHSVMVVPYSTRWRALFDTLRDELHEVFAPGAVRIEHIGSTAVPGLAAKPVIDILLGAPSLDAIEARVDALADRGYRYVPEYERDLPMRRHFVRTAQLRVHLHGVAFDSPLWRDQLTFRDALQADAALRERYAALKLGLAQAHAHAHAQDKSAYTAGKGPFIRTVLDSVRRTALGKAPIPTP